ncbi:MAG: cytochrome c oxidase assembly protein [Chloroflexi bacterium]|nr:cytochrome c oxidase assembly protein [Chloroflexota bacterium]
MMTPLLLHAASGPYRFAWHAHPDVILVCVGLLAAYFYVGTRLRHGLSDAGRLPRRKVALFVSGVFALWAVAGTPVHDISEQYLLLFHMTQHTVFILVAAPLLLAGIPAWMWQALFRVKGVLPVARVVTHPIFAFSVFNGVLVLTHLPVSVNYSLYHHWFHFLVHTALVLSAVAMWWAVLSEVPELPALSAPLKMGYLFAQSLLPAVLSSFVTFADGTVYSFYETAPRMWGLSPVVDQQIGGGLMKVFGSVILWTFITVVFFQWYNREDAATKGPDWDDVNEELESMGLTARR